MLRSLVLLFCALSAACAAPSRTQKIQSAHTLECKIKIAAILKMRESGNLADPQMIAGCPTNLDLNGVDISPRPFIAPPVSNAANVTVDQLINSQMPPSVANEIRTSTAFEDLIQIKNSVDQ